MSSNGRKIRDQIFALLSRKDYRPLNKIEIARKIEVSGRARVALRRMLRDLERSWKYFERSDLLSAVDAVSFVLMADRRIQTAFAFDGHFAIAGFRMIG